MVEVAPILPPDHEPIPTGVDRVKEAAPKVVRAGVLAVSLYQRATEAIQFDPVVQAFKQPEHADDPANEDYSVLRSWSKESGAGGSTGGIVITPPTGELGFSGYAPTANIATST